MPSVTSNASPAAPAATSQRASDVLSTSARYPAIASFVYVVSPINAFILFRHTDRLQSYPDRTDLTLAAAPAVVLAGGAAVALLVRDGPRSISRSLDSLAAWGVTILFLAGLLAAGIGVLRHNSPSLVVSDLLPIAELALFFYIGRSVLDLEHDLAPLLLLTGASLALNLAIRFVFFWQVREQLPVLAQNYTHGFYGDGITALYVIHPICSRTRSPCSSASPSECSSPPAARRKPESSTQVGEQDPAVSRGLVLRRARRRGCACSRALCSTAGGLERQAETR